MIFEPVVRFYKAFKDLKSYKNKILKKTEHYFAMTHKTENVPKAPRNSTILFLFSKLLILVDLGCFLLGGATWITFRDAQKDPQMHERIRRCTKGSADAQKDPQMHKRIRLAYPPRKCVQ